MNDTINYGTEIVNNLEKKGESPSYIIGFLQATLNSLRHIDNEKVLEYLKQTLKQTQN